MKHKQFKNKHVLVKAMYSRICLIRHLKGIRKKWRIRWTDELCKQVKTPS